MRRIAAPPTALLLGALLPLAARAAEPLGKYVAPEAAPISPSPTLLLLRSLASLALVVGLVLITAWLYRLRSGATLSPSLSRLRVLESVALGTGRSLHLVAVGQQVLLLGGGQQVTHLATFGATEVGYDPQDAAPPSFESLLGRITQSGRERPGAAATGD
ncbi:MAG: flagellar biosynthetic protein FliO [Fimbriimonadaceae bacterium]|nr:flagellar biosynthetic protein FliO [Fimbriimonadaceae bacterium]